MFDEDEEMYEEYSDFEYFEESVSESMRLIVWTALITLFAVGLLVAVAL